MTAKPPALFTMSPELVPRLYPEPLMRRLTAVLDIDPAGAVQRFEGPEADAALSQAEVIVSGWGSARFDEALLERAPRLRAILHTAGSIKWHVSPLAWERGIAVSSSVGANALPVAEYTLGSILLAGKGIFTQREDFRARRSFTLGLIHEGVGNFGRVVGIVGASRIGRRLIELLRPFDFQVLLSDPHVDAAEADRLGVRLVELDDLMAASDVVTVHAPALPETDDLIDAKRLAAMRDGAVLINTARGSLVNTDALTAELESGRISAIIDVTEPEPLPTESVLYDLPNVFLTPHTAGSHGNELARMGLFMVEEAERFIAGEPLVHTIDRDSLWKQA
ncbi:hydroxyacid dehydrogenase [Glycomyces buryatensis]|uniref:Hydroxyacid dehydrogenase n=1 Tax=Glycomyces buryatensis TaxID=2570927 RepID=A0A4S8Q813_9ACTN|nr:hydroxyacid dehydrogenase [Glycomyces buryatensis]THV37009.1 hydroxyacid dehydrogenase [Glycomyces buryatensis]